MVNKVGSEKYYILISLILGLMVLALSLFFIFNEYFNEDELAWQQCRQSVILRSGDVNNMVKKVQEEAVPFKCKTNVVEIKSDDRDEVLEKIAETLAMCHYTYGEGKLQLYADNWIDSNDFMCFVCARIHFDESIKDDFENLNVGEYLVKKKFRDGMSYFDYLYWNREPVVSRDVLERQVIEGSVFNSIDGDIFVVPVYRKGNLMSEYFMDFNFWQQGIEDELSKCTTIETIPA